MEAAKAGAAQVLHPDVFFLRIFHRDLWQGTAFLDNIGAQAALSILLPGILIGIGTVFLPKPGRGSAG